MENLTIISTNNELKSKYGVLLSTEQNNALNALNLTNSEKKIIKARESFKIINSSDQDVISIVSKMIHVVHANMNRPIPSEIIQFENCDPISQYKYDVLEVSNYLLQNCKHLTVSEIDLIFRNGVTGLYGQVFGLNTITYISWINGYKQSEERLNAISKLSNLKIKKMPETINKSKDETYKLMVETTISVSKNQNGLVSFPLSLIYSFLIKCKILEFSKDEKLELYIEAKNKMIEKIKSDTLIGKYTFSEAKSKLSKVQNEKWNQSVILELQKKIVLDLFEQNKAFDIEMSDLFNEETFNNYQNV